MKNKRKKQFCSLGLGIVILSFMGISIYTLCADNHLAGKDLLKASMAQKLLF